MATTIFILDGNPSTGTLTLDPCDTVPVEKNKHVKWKIKSSATNVASFRIQKKASSSDIFDSSEQPPSHQTRDGQGKVKFNAGNNDVYDYSIFWKVNPNDKNELEFDPKLAVMPSPGPSNMAMLIAGVAMTALGLIAMQFWFRSQRRRKAAFKRR